MSPDNISTKAEDSLSYNKLLMCPPEYFAVVYEINQWMQPQAWRDNPDQLKQIAGEEWQNLYDTFKTLGIAIDLIKPEQEVPDLVFTANAAIILDQRVLLASFRYKERQPEQRYFAQYFHKLKDDGLVQSIDEFPQNIFQEGAGDCIWDSYHKLFWAGYGPRSSKEACSYIEKYYAKEVIALELLSSRFYHLDLSLSALKNGEILYYPDAFSAASQNTIKERVQADQLIALDKEDAYNFVCNLVNFGDKIILSHCSDKLKNILQERGYSVISTPVDKFGLSGGSVCCLTLKLNLQSSPKLQHDHIKLDSLNSAIIIVGILHLQTKIVRSSRSSASAGVHFGISKLYNPK